MKYFFFLLLMVNIPCFAQNKEQISSFINGIYGNDYYLLERKAKPILLTELNDDWSKSISLNSRQQYTNALKNQNISQINWQDYNLKRAILCENGIPIISEKNIPYDCILFIPENLTKKEKAQIINTKKPTQFIIYSKKNWNEDKKKTAYYSFLKNFKKAKKNETFKSISLSQPIFFDKYVLISSYSSSKLSTCIFEQKINTFHKLDCESLNYK
ncbi:hypothetical protein MKS83_13290 [Chryseobacterium sp. Y16C]|uniref:hypothetical protein n=1 Tax=Chryseobacterium sp. Y16C TaxID=2920939 RepID=UPI001F0B564D|nr:hypothetical protein [Chryseobacterium sp. Y16C]UMQ40371.1 hypothetical protein MKS83_13290 [Chryseobacterium sp. Y16C]